MPAFATNNVNVWSPPKPAGFTQQQTDATQNYQRAQAQAVADPRMNMKAYDKAGLSRGKGQQQYAASAAANAYANAASAAESAPLQDAASSANLGLQYAASQDQMGLQLAQLQEQMRQQQALAALQQQANGMGFVGGSVRNILSGLMG
jgi:hypothetical protein